MNILITGAGGFVGKHLRKYFNDKGYKLFTPTHKELNLLDEKKVGNFFKSHKIDVVIHTALVGGSRAEEFEKSALDKNLQMFFNLVRNKKRFKRMIQFGSGAEYDKRFPMIRIKENDFDKKIPADEYGFAKYICSKYIESSENITCLRIFGLFGPGEDYRYRFISNAACRNILGLPITMRQNVYFDYIYIKDFLKIVEYFVKHRGKHKFYNIGTGKKIDLETITAKINGIAEVKSKVIVKKPGLNNEYTCDNERLLKEMPKFKFTDFNVCLKELYDWYKKNRRMIKKETI